MAKVIDILAEIMRYRLENHVITIHPTLKNVNGISLLCHFHDK